MKINSFLTVINFLLLLYLFFLLNINNKDAFELWIQAIAAFATVAAVFVALFQDWIRYTFLPPKLKIELHNYEGVVISGGEAKTIYYHLKVVNYRRWSVARNCEVLLVEIKTKLNDSNFKSFPLAVPRNFDWTPASTKSSAITIYEQAVLDLLRLESKKDFIMPCLNRYYRDDKGNFEGFVRQGEVKRYVTQIIGDNIPSKRQTFEISWDGISPEISLGHLLIKEIVE